MTELEKAAREYASFDVSEGGLTGLRGIEAGKYEPFIAGAQWQAKQSPWISVEEKLPPMAEHVVLKKGAFYVGFGFFGENMVFHSVTIGDNSLVPKTVAFTHWMPIPE